MNLAQPAARTTVRKVGPQRYGEYVAASGAENAECFLKGALWISDVLKRVRGYDNIK